MHRLFGVIRAYGLKGATPHWFILAKYYTCSALASLIEDYPRTRKLFVIGFNLSNVYVLLHRTLTYGNSPICPNLGNWAWEFLCLLVLVWFLIAH